MILLPIAIAVLLIWLFQKKEEDTPALGMKEIYRRHFPEQYKEIFEPDPLPKVFIGKMPNGNMLILSEQERNDLMNEAKAAGGRLIDQYLELYHQGKITKEECERGMNEILDSYPKNDT